jgi:hypothetical protein
MVQDLMLASGNSMSDSCRLQWHVGEIGAPNFIYSQQIIIILNSYAFFCFRYLTTE